VLGALPSRWSFAAAFRVFASGMAMISTD
jgi:hypothetical protein